MSNAAVAGLDSCYNTARQSNFSPSCVLMQFTQSSAQVNNILEENLSHISVFGITRNRTALNFFFLMTNKRYENVVSHDCFNKLKVLNGEGRIFIGSDISSWGYFSLVRSFFLRLPISNLSPLPAMD